MGPNRDDRGDRIPCGRAAIGPGGADRSYLVDVSAAQVDVYHVHVGDERGDAAVRRL